LSRKAANRKSSLKVTIEDAATAAATKNFFQPVASFKEKQKTVQQKIPSNEIRS